MNTEADQLIVKALGIIEKHVQLMPVFHYPGGEASPLMAAAELLETASSLAPGRPLLRFTKASILRLCLQNKAANDELLMIMNAYPQFALARFAQEAWEKVPIFPAVFGFPQWSPAHRALPSYYATKLTTSILFPTREGINPMPVFFEKDGDGWWTAQKLRGVSTEIGIVWTSANPNVAGMYLKHTGPGLAKPDLQESVVVLNVPKGNPGLAPWLYLCDQSVVGICLVNRAHDVILSSSLSLSPKARQTMDKIRTVLLETKGQEISQQEWTRNVDKYQAATDMDEILRTRF